MRAHACLRSFSKSRSVVGGGQVMTTRAEMFSNRSEWLEESLSLFRGLEPAHRVGG